MEKLDCLYEDTKYNIISGYKKAKQHSIDYNYTFNIVGYNDYITDEVIGKGGFEHPLDAFYNVLSICAAMAQLDLMDEYFFEDINEYIEKYHNGEYDEYFFDIKEDKKEIDKDIETVLNYYKQYKDTK